mmetsp:Transcript_19754/g.50558  ORF Transcript_19754/g.50558 Transcript_19754/m.50558 type:complete len:231 (+) Transcript_19754:371-1063(+)
MAAGSAGLTISLISPSPGIDSTAHLNAASARGSASAARTAPTSCSSISSGLPSAASSSRRSIKLRARFCSASQRLKSSVSAATSSSWSAGLRSLDSTTGAEKPRSSEGTGRSGMPSKVNVCSASVRLSTVSVSPALFSASSAFDSEPMRPSLMGIRKGCFSGWPGVAGQLCLQVSWSVCASASYAVEMSTRGVPACEYQRSNWVRSMSFASAIAARKSSQVTAPPSWRSK